MFGWIKKAILGRWLARWLLRGSPWAVVAKLAAVAAWGAWRWRRRQNAAEQNRRSREIPAEYEVLEPRSPDRIPGRGEPAGRGEGRDEGARPGSSGRAADLDFVSPKNSNPMRSQSLSEEEDA